MGCRYSVCRLIVAFHRYRNHLVTDAISFCRCVIHIFQMHMNRNIFILYRRYIYRIQFHRRLCCLQGRSLIQSIGNRRCIRACRPSEEFIAFLCRSVTVYGKIAALRCARFAVCFQKGTSICGIVFNCISNLIFFRLPSHQIACLLCNRCFHRLCFLRHLSICICLCLSLRRIRLCTFCGYRRTSLRRHAVLLCILLRCNAVLLRVLLRCHTVLLRVLLRCHSVLLCIFLRRFRTLLCALRYCSLTLYCSILHHSLCCHLCLLCRIYARCRV